MLTTFSKLFSGLLEKTDKKVILNRFDFIFDNIKDHTLPMLDAPNALGSETKPYQLLEKALQRRAKVLTGRNETPITYLRQEFKKLNDKRSEYRDLFDGAFKRDIFKDALSYEQANLLSLLLAIEDLSQYTRKLMVILARLEMGDPLKKGENAYLETVLDDKAITAAVITLQAISVGPEKILTALTKLKAITYSPDDEAMVTRIRGAQTDPLKMGLLPGIGHVVLFALEMHNQYTANQYEKAKAEKAKFELEIMYLNRRKENATEEELENIAKQISYYQSRIDKLEAKIEDIEEEAQGYDYN